MDMESTHNQTSSSLQVYSIGIDQAIIAWLDAKFKKSKSEKTRKAYSDTLNDFRITVQGFSLDLDGDPRQINLIAQGWASRRAPGATREGDVAQSTFNQRLAIVSSFYDYARKHQMITTENPIDMVERAKVQDYGTAEALEHEDVKAVLDKIERKTLVGKRDYALLSLTLFTGRRVSEIASIHYGSLTIRAANSRRGELVKVHFARVKGGETASNDLDTGTSAALLDYIHSLYGSELGSLPHNAPLWVSFSNNHTKGQPIGIKALEAICKKRCGSSRFHLLRHSFAVGAEEAGATASDIQAMLGHKSLATTGRYLAHFKRSKNKVGAKLESLFGISVPEDEE